jgi:hypothetical protein
MYPLIVARQRLGKNVTAATNKQVTIGGLLNASFSIQSVAFIYRTSFLFELLNLLFELQLACL